MRVRIAVLLLVIFLGASLASQPVTDVKVRQLNDRRTSGKFFAGLTLSLELPKFKSSEVAASRVTVTEATDDTGRDLVDPDAGERSMDTNQRADLLDKTAPVWVSAEVKNPDRKATRLASVRGEIELFMPAKDPNSIAEITKFMPQSGKPLAHKALKANGIEITLLTPAQIAAEKKRRADAKRKEYKEAGYDDEMVESTVKSLMEYELDLEDSELVARIKDPQNRIQDVIYIDEQGNKGPISMREDDGVVRLSTWFGNPQPNWKLRVTMRTDKNTAKYTFALKDVALP